MIYLDKKSNIKKDMEELSDKEYARQLRREAFLEAKNELKIGGIAIIVLAVILLIVGSIVLVNRNRISKMYGSAKKSVKDSIKDINKSSLFACSKNLEGNYIYNDGYIEYKYILTKDYKADKQVGDNTTYGMYRVEDNILSIQNVLGNTERYIISEDCKSLTSELYTNIVFKKE